MDPDLDIVILGLSMTSSWGNGHATTYRSLLRGLAALGHRVLFLERNLLREGGEADPPPHIAARTETYSTVDELRDRFTTDVRQADLVIVGSFLPEGASVCRWVLQEARGVTAFYDIDTPVTLAMLETGHCPHLTAAQIPDFDLFLSFTGGPTLQRLERDYRATRARALYCAVDQEEYAPDHSERRWSLAYLGTYNHDRQPLLDQLLIQAARQCPCERFAVAGPMYPADIAWPENVDRIAHLEAGEHRAFYNSQRFALNITRADVLAAGYSPSVRLFEAAACGTPVISDAWPGLDEFFVPGREILIAASTADMVAFLREMPEEHRQRVSCMARQRVLCQHTSTHRAAELVGYFLEACGADCRAAYL